MRVRPDAPVGATLGELRDALAPLGFDEDAFVAWATERSTPRPPNYVEIINANMGRSELAGRNAAAPRSGPEPLLGLSRRT